MNCDEEKKKQASFVYGSLWYSNMNREKLWQDSFHKECL